MHQEKSSTSQTSKVDLNEVNDELLEEAMDEMRFARMERATKRMIKVRKQRGKHAVNRRINSDSK